jgi:hypothetical protein
MTSLSSPQNSAIIESITGSTTFFVVLLHLLLGWPAAEFGLDIDNVPPVLAANTEFGWWQVLGSVVALGAIAVWVSLPRGGSSMFSDFGIVEFFPVLTFYNSTILPPSRLAALPWKTILKLLGENKLSKAVSNSD